MRFPIALSAALALSLSACQGGFGSGGTSAPGGVNPPVGSPGPECTSTNADAKTLRCSKHAAGNRRHLSDQGRRSRVKVSGGSRLLVHAAIRSHRALAVAVTFTVIERIGFRLAFAVANTNADTDAIARTERFSIRKCVTKPVAKRSAYNVAHRRLAQRRAQDAESRPEGSCDRRTRHTAFAHRCRRHARR